MDVVAEKSNVQQREGGGSLCGELYSRKEIIAHVPIHSVVYLTAKRNKWHRIRSVLNLPFVGFDGSSFKLCFRNTCRRPFEMFCIRNHNRDTLFFARTTWLVVEITALTFPLMLLVQKVQMRRR
ncbi:hypothetical protein DM01DRAFT_1074616 [Hesseltinella vesiculosa]|uniref:Uncharacterized protein n=1 Tax=Hesseltinella vesiculosa TaxID=101127 RepID=A0A1X2GVZ1_9FUNG|nr:hypothetical protein DM01DRAFT_1074616 [Hesseltinella vesiculosa]